jgi:hypothetical protein
MRKRNSAIISGLGIIALLLALAPVLHATSSTQIRFSVHTGTPDVN